MNLAARLRAFWLRLGSALTGDVPHPFSSEYPWPGGCWCNKPEEDPVHADGRRRQ